MGRLGAWIGLRDVEDVRPVGSVGNQVLGWGVSLDKDPEGVSGKPDLQDSERLVIKLGTRHLSSHSGLERHILMISGGLRKAGVEHLGFRRVRKVILSFFSLFSSLCLSRGLAFPLSVLLGPRDPVP